VSAAPDERPRRDKPWYPGQPVGVVLCLADGGWRWSAVTQRDGKRGLTCGRLDGGLLEPEAKEALLRNLACDGVELVGEWRSDRPGRWTADMRPVPGA
jgi:hypothetical protein